MWSFDVSLQAANYELGSRGERVLAFAELPLDKDKFPLGFLFDTDKINFPMSNLRFCGSFFVYFLPPPFPPPPPLAFSTLRS
jgi:sodium/potassium-transporting ATPase subunit alpha